jgi:hypothetical protein
MNVIILITFPQQILVQQCIPRHILSFPKLLAVEEVGPRTEGREARKKRRARLARKGKKRL